MKKSRNTAVPGRETSEVALKTVVSSSLTERFPGADRFLLPAARFLVPAVAGLGLNLFLSDALAIPFRFTEACLPVLFFLTVLVLLFLPGKRRLFGVGLLLTGAALSWILTGRNPAELLRDGVVCLWNAVMERIDEFGYISLPMLPDEGSDPVRAAILTSLIGSLLFFFSVRKKTRLFPILFSLVLICTPILLYNMPNENTGAALLTASLAGFAAMRLCERNTETGELSGFIGSAVLILSLLLLLIPARAVKTPWREIPGLSEKMEELRLILTEIAEGKSPFSGEAADDGGNPHDVTPSRRVFTGKPVMTVYSDVNMPVYLRQWVGAEFSRDRWYPPVMTRLPFEEPGVKTPDGTSSVTVNFLQFLSALYGDSTGSTAEVPNRLCLVPSRITVVPQRTGRLIPLPYLTASGITDPQGRIFSETISVISDGMLSVPRLNSGTPYSVGTLLPRAGSIPDFEENLRAFFQYALFVDSQLLPTDPAVLDFLSAPEAASFRDYVQFNENCTTYVKTVYGEKLVFSDAIERFVSSMFTETEIGQYYNVRPWTPETAKEQNGLITVYGDFEQPSRIYYLSTEGEVIYADAVARLVASCLCDRCRYSLDPDFDPEADLMLDFLFGSQEGYCVQFATAATLILRRLGFTARYVEGYLAQDFAVNPSDRYEATYSAVVKDQNAHAWTEVWISGYGWKVYEVTPNHYLDFYIGGQQPAVTDEPETDPAPETDPDPVTAETDRPVTGTVTGSSETESVPDTETSEQGIEPVGRSGALWLLLPALLLALIPWGLHTVKQREARQRRLTVALSGCPEKKIPALGTALAGDLSDMLSAYRLTPAPGELPKAFSRRVDEALAPLASDPSASAALEAVSRIVYGDRIDGETLRTVACVIRNLDRQALRRLGLPRYFRCRFISCLL